MIDWSARHEELAKHLSFFVPPGFLLMKQAEVDRIHNEAEALRIERGAAREDRERAVLALKGIRGVLGGKEVGQEDALVAYDAAGHALSALGELPSREYRCPRCGHMADTPQHELGCVPFREIEVDRG